MSNPEAAYQVVINAQEVVCEHPRRKREQIRWDDVEEVMIVTLDTGPAQPDVWMVLSGHEQGCSAPQGAQGYEALYAHVSQWPRFNHQRVIDAMGSTQRAQFICWQKESS